jgi:tol-pal system protein YbgF
VAARFLATALGLVLAPACAGAGASAGAEAGGQRLLTMIDELRDQLNRQEAHIEELSNRVFVLYDRVDTARVEMGRASTPPTLEVVKLVPDEEAPPAVADGGDDAAVVIQLRDDGELEALPTREVPPPPRNGPPERGAEEVFTQALNDYRQGQVESAYRGFAQFLARFPRHAYADNAVYWMGECRYDAREYRAAVAEFAKVLKRFPRSNKVPDALFKLGLAYERLGEREVARKAFADVVAGYPKSAFAELARAHLDALAAMGGSR